MSGPLHDQLGFAPDYNFPVPYCRVAVTVHSTFLSMRSSAMRPSMTQRES